MAVSFHPAKKCDEEAACHLRPLHEMVMKGTGEFKKEETLLFLLSYLIQNLGTEGHLLFGKEGKSSVTYQDLAHVMLDIVEKDTYKCEWITEWTI